MILMKQQLPILDDMAILALTRQGEQELGEPGTALSPALLAALVLIDGHTAVAQMVKRACTTEPDALRANLNKLITNGFVYIVADSAQDSIDPGDFFTSKTANAAATGVSEHIHAEIETDAEFLRRNGYYVNMARNPAVTQVRAEERKLTVLVIDDDPDICKLLQMFLKLEGFDTRTAANRAEIVAEFRRSSLPDLVLLDVSLTDVNGFEVLAAMRRHQLLKELPVIMLTADATRGAVLKGIQGGANGFITKPFLIHPLVNAVKIVLGMNKDQNH